MKTLIGYSKRFTIAPLARHLTCLALLISAAGAGDEVRVEKSGDAVIVRSGSDHANFLFRAPADFDQQTPEKPFLVHLAADRGGAKGSIRLRIGDVALGDTGKPAATLARAREAKYKKGAKGDLKIEGTGARAIATMPGRTILLVRDGTKLYELFLEGAAAFSEEFATVADGFTILSPKGVSIKAAATPEDLKAKKLSHDYYKLALLKPQGFTQQAVDPNNDPGIWIELRGEDEQRNLCVIKVRVFLARTSKKSAGDRAQAALEKFSNKYPPARAPKRPQRAGFPGSKESFKLKMSGKLPKSGIVIQDESRFLEHENGRIYEIRMQTYAGGQRIFKKQIKSFWKSLRIKHAK